MYAPSHADLDDLCRLLSAGIDVATPVGFVYPTPRSAPAEDQAGQAQGDQSGVADGGVGS